MSDSDIYNNARYKSVNTTQEQEQSRVVQYTKRDMRTSNRNAYRKGAKDGFKKGFLSAAIVAVLLCGGFKLGEKAIVVMAGNEINTSVDAGFTAVREETHRTADNQGYWYDYYDIVRSFDEDTMDFDSFVYGTYQKVGWNAQSRLDCMDELFFQFKLCDLTDFSSFLAYCESKGLCKEVDGKLQVDMKAYEKAIKEYVSSLGEVQELEDNIDEFRHGR